MASGSLFEVAILQRSGRKVIIVPAGLFSRAFGEAVRFYFVAVRDVARIRVGANANVFLLAGAQKSSQADECKECFHSFR